MNYSPNTALIIDDDPDVCHLLVKALATSNIQASTAHTLEEAEECLEKVRPKLILLDNNLPDGRGIDFIKKIKAFDTRTKIIMITADSNSHIRQRAAEEGVHTFLPKPFTIEAIRYYADDAIRW